MDREVEEACNPEGETDDATSEIGGSLACSGGGLFATEQGLVYARGEEIFQAVRFRRPFYSWEGRGENTCTVCFIPSRKDELNPEASFGLSISRECRDEGPIETYYVRFVEFLIYEVVWTSMKNNF